MAQHAPLVWIDCEMTGLDQHKDALIEVAVLITDSQLQILDEGIQVVIKPDEAALNQMDDFVRNMHVESGLLEQLPDGLSMSEASELVMEYVTSRVPEPRTGLLAGNSVGNDKIFLARDMPELINHLHYRIVDVSTVKELARRWYPNEYARKPEKTGNHRALGDIQDSISELAYYKSTIFRSETLP